MTTPTLRRTFASVIILSPIVPSLIGTEKNSRAPFQTPFPRDDGSRSFRDIFKIVKSVDHESNTGSYVLWGIGGIADSRKLYPCLF